MRTDDYAVNEAGERPRLRLVTDAVTILRGDWRLLSSNDVLGCGMRLCDLLAGTDGGNGELLDTHKERKREP